MRARMGLWNILCERERQQARAREREQAREGVQERERESSCTDDSDDRGWEEAECMKV